MEQKQTDAATKVKHTFMDRLETAAAAPVFLHDRIQEAFDRVVIYIWRSIVTEYHNARTRYRASSREMIVSGFILSLVICALLLTFEYNTVYEYSYNGRVLGYVKRQETVTDLLEVAGEGMSGNSDINIVFTANDNVTFRKVALAKHDIDTSDQVLNKLTYMTEIEVSATGIYYDGKLVALVENDIVANNLIANMLKTYGKADDGMVVQEASFKYPVETGQIDVMLTSLVSRNKAFSLLSQGGSYRLQHMVKPDETVESIAEAYGVEPTNIFEEGRSIPATEVIAGEVVTIKKDVDPIVVRIEEKGTTSEVMRFTRETKDTPDLWIGQTEIEQKGEDGKKLVTGTIVKENGVEVERNITNTEIVKEPVTEIVLNGTTERPKTAPTGIFAMPLKDHYTVTSPYGFRWGRLHAGVDMACPSGTTVYASDGGVVVRASWYSSFGNCIEIEHLDGTYTRYAHLSGYLVSAGDEVYQGQEIGFVGSTGFSTGPHLHFEIHPYGTSTIDPASVLDIY